MESVASHTDCGKHKCIATRMTALVRLSIALAGRGEEAVVVKSNSSSAALLQFSVQCE